MALITVCVVAVLLAAAYAQTTQHLVYYPEWCLRTVAQESTGEVWAEMWYCKWSDTFHISAPASDATIRTGDDLCLSAGGSEGAFFETCKKGEPLQKWEFVPTGVTSEKLAAPDGPDTVPGQIVLASADANTDRPKMCLKANDAFVEGARITTVQCDSVGSAYTTWTYAPPPPADKVLLFMPARHAAGAKACVQMISNAGDYPQLGDCGDEDLVLNWWVREGDLIRSAADGGRCLVSVGSDVFFNDCDPDRDDQRWSLGADGSLKHTTKPEDGCVTYTGEELPQFRMKPCTGDSMQAFAFLPAAPTTDGVQVV